MYDLLIKKGNIADGSKRASFVADIAVKDGSIVAIGTDLGGETKRTINADGLVVTPGFIDNHSHSDFGITSEHHFDNVVEQGITTEIVGQCGNTFAPASPEMVQQAAGMMGLSEDDVKFYSRHMASFETYAAYLDNMDLGVNWAFLAGHSAIREYVMGYENRSPSSEELDRMKDQVKQAMEAGALGVSTGLIYPPGAYADIDELVALLKVAAPYGGTYTTHMRSEGDTIIEAIQEALEIGKRAGVAVNISHMKLGGKNNWHKLDEVFELIEKAQNRGVKVRSDMYPYLAGCTSLVAAIPNKFMAQGFETLVENLKAKDLRQTIIQELETGTGFENLIKYCGFNGITVVSAPVTTELIGKNIAEIAEASNSDPFDTFCDTIIKNQGNVSAAFFVRSEDHIAQQFLKPYMMGGTDGGIDAASYPSAHPRHTGTFPQLIRKFVREQKIVSIEEAAHKFSYLPAELAGFKNKGLIKQGFDADIAIFDLDTLTDHADYLNPKAKNEGMKYVIVNGVVAVENDRFTGKFNGKLLRRG